MKGDLNVKNKEIFVRVCYVRQKVSTSVTRISKMDATIKHRGEL